MAIVENDIRFSPLESDAASGEFSNVLRMKSRLWPGGVVPYVLQDGIRTYCSTSPNNCHQFILLLLSLSLSTTLEPGEQSVKHSGVSPMPANVLLLAIWTSVLSPFKFSADILVALVIKYFFKKFRKDPASDMISQKPMFYQSIKHRKACFVLRV